MSMSNTEKTAKDLCRPPVALDRAELTPRELAWHITDSHHYFLSTILDDYSRYISGELKAWRKDQDIEYTRGASYYPQRQGKIERYHRSMQCVVKLEKYHYSWELEKAIGEWVIYCNHQRYHKSLDKVTPADFYEGRRNDILDQCAALRSRTMM